MVMPAIRYGRTAADVRLLSEESDAGPRYELIDGELLVTPAPRAEHQFAVVEFERVLYEYVEREQLGSTLHSPADLELKPESVTQPDVFVVPATENGPRAEPLTWKDITSLLLAVEVLSPSTARQD